MKSKLKYVTDQQVLDFWTKEYPASQRSNESGEVTSWVVSKFGPFMSNEMMRNIIGQTVSGFNLRDIMDNKKILLVNLSKGRMGELNSKLLGMIFVMKFQAAAMGRADIPEDQRVNFSLYVDEFQNFATESFESILSEARKYRLSLIVANQFMTQLTDKIREAIIGNVGTVVSGRIGVTDAELLVKKFSPVFDVEDITRLPNFEGIASVMIKDMPSSPFSISFLPPLVHPNEELAKALRRLTAAKFGKPRAVVEQEIFSRLRSGEEEKRLKQEEMMKKMSGKTSAPATSGGSFLDEWLAKRKANQAQLPKTSNQSPVSLQPAVNSVPVPVAPSAPARLAESDDKALSSMLKQDELGKLKNSLTTPTDIKYNVTGKQSQGDVVSAMNDTQDVDQIVGETQEKIQEGKGMLSQSPQEEKNHLQIKRSPLSGAEFPADSHDDVDEIVIDVRGNIHHRDPSFEKNNQ